MIPNLKKFTKGKLLSLHYLANTASKLNKNKKGEPFLCIITPVFDPSLISLKKLINDMKQQKLKDFIHVVVSNGASPKIEKYITALHSKDSRFVYIMLLSNH